MEKLMNKTERIANNVTKGYHTIETGAVRGYQKLQDGVVCGYERMQNSIVRGFTRMMDRCVQVLFAKEGESVDEAKARLRK